MTQLNALFQNDSYRATPLWDLGLALGGLGVLTLILGLGILAGVLWRAWTRKSHKP
jgi:hypothetical protein